MDDFSTTDGEREMEVEALLAIYEDDLKILDKDDKNSMSFEIELKSIEATLTLTLSDEYPMIAPIISVQKSGKNLVELEELLKKTSDSLCGEVMIHSLIEEANVWAGEKRSQYVDSNKEQEQSGSVCKFFLEGRCKFGDKCLNSHQLARNEDSEETPQCRDENKEKEAGEIESSKVTKRSTNSTENKEGRTAKKAPMKTATDVISRILWDNKLDPKDFTIGYLDRFIGIIEREFSDFSWEDIASVDYDVLSIPKHRIQYFKYHEEIVWDKRNRVDKIFGSTGSGCTIHEVMERENKQEKREEESGVKEEKKNEEKDEDVFCDIVNTSQRNNKGPNYFIAFKVQDAGILENVEELQKELVLREKNMSEGVVLPQSLHVTLLVLTIRNEDELDLVKDVLKGVHHVLPSTLPPSSQLHFKGIGSFNDRLLYVGVDKEPNLQKFVEILKRQLHKAGINLDGNREVFAPHVTIVRAPSSTKMSRATSRDVFYPFESTYRDFEFGTQGINEIGLFSRFDPKDPDGFHRTVLTVKNSLLSVLPTLEKKVTDYVDDLYDSEKISVELKQKIKVSFDSKTPVEIDEAFTLLEAVVQKDPSKLVLVLRGIPGSGKTYLLENSFENSEMPGLTVCSSKQLFYRAGSVKMDQSELNIAEAYCRNGFLEALNGGASVVAVDDCHAQTWKYAFYRKIARIFGFSVRVLEIKASDRDVILECLKHGESGSCMDDLLEMVREWEEDPEALHVEPWFRNPTLQRQEGISLRNLVKSVQ